PSSRREPIWRTAGSRRSSLRSHKLMTLVAKEWRELLASRAYWLVLVMIGPLVGHGFITAVNSYAEASGIGGGPAALAQGLSPLDGILVPAFGAYDLVVILLFPFVAIRMVAAEKESGASKLCVQFPAGLKMAMAAKGLALVGGWLVAWIPGLLALILWRSYGGHLYRPETVNLFAGHLVHMMLGAGVAVAAAALTESASSAAIIALGFTLGSWAIDFVAAARGGFLQEVAAYTPAAALRVFEHGMLSLRVVVVVLILSLSGLWLAAIWLDTGRRLGNRLLA